MTFQSELDDLTLKHSNNLLEALGSSSNDQFPAIKEHVFIKALGQFSD